jgi:two-component system, chemotaxis family, chemotaxis protein CheY
MTFLVVDDSAVTRKIIINDITPHRQGKKDTYLQAEDGMEALEQLFSNKVDLVLCDWNMPAMDGLEFLQSVRKKDEYKSLPVIMITSENERTYVEQAVRAGITDYILKPLTKHKVWSKIERHILNIEAR